MSNRQSIELDLTLGFVTSMGSLRPKLIKLELLAIRHSIFSTVLARLQHAQNGTVVFRRLPYSGISSSSSTYSL
jgi:hypothetical protein